MREIDVLIAQASTKLVNMTELGKTLGVIRRASFISANSWQMAFLMPTLTSQFMTSLPTRMTPTGMTPTRMTPTPTREAPPLRRMTPRLPKLGFWQKGEAEAMLGCRILVWSPIQISKLFFFSHFFSLFYVPYKRIHHDLMV